jgi:(p)ppGpp synthase/HD superfamily hydrolase
MLFAENTALHMQNYFTTELICAALLHDTIEDTELTFEDIKLEFGEIIATHVQDLTRIKECGTKITAGESIEQLYIQQKIGSIIVKMFDRIHNMQTINSKSPESIKRTVDETLKNFIITSIFLESKEIENMLTQLCYKNLYNNNTINISNKNILTYPTFQNEINRERILNLLES